MKLLTTLALVVACGGLRPCDSARAEPPHGDPALLLGVAWYPEQWPETRWDADLTLMETARVRVVRLAEFSWSSLEPREGDYRLDWLDRAIRAAERHHIAVVLGTPSAAPPAWLTETYPETLLTHADGTRAVHGGRQQSNWSDPTYRILVAGIVSQMGDRFGHDPNVIGWQIDNEYSNESHDAATRARFQAWLRTRYGTLDALNARWSTAYWSQTYQDWRQIPIPADRNGNPGLMLAWNTFVSETWRSFQKAQLDILRARVLPRQKVTTNFFLWSDSIDQNVTVQDLDFAAWDDYVATGHLDPEANGLLHDMVRGFLHGSFWVMETQPGAVNWALVSNSLDQGETRAMAWNAVGHGADAVVYWQWRSALNGQEQYHGVLVGADGTPVPIYDEVARIGAEFAKASSALEGTTVEAKVALINDVPSRWALGWQQISQTYDAAKVMTAYYAPLHDLARSVDVVSVTAPLSSYRLVVAPNLNVIAPEAADRLAAYVRDGGHLVLGARSGLKDEDNGLWRQRQPGPLADLLGARVAQYYALDGTAPVNGLWGRVSAGAWAERLDVLAPDTEVLMRYGAFNGWLDGQPAVVTREVGRGRITYIGANLDAAGLKAATAWMAQVSGVDPVLPDLPAGIDVGLRSGPGHRLSILTNYGQEIRDVALPEGSRDVLADAPVSTVRLGRYGVAIIEERRP